MRAVVMRVEGSYSVNINLQYPRIGFIPSPSTIAGAYVHAGMTVLGNMSGKLINAIKGAYIVFGEDTLLTVNTIMNRGYIRAKGKDKFVSDTNLTTKIVDTKNLYAVVLLGDVNIGDDQLTIIGENIPTFGWNDSMVWVREVFVENVKRARSEYVNSYVRAVDSDVKRMVEEMIPFISLKLKEDVVIRTSPIYEKTGMKIEDYITPVVAVGSSENAVLMTANAGAGKVFVKDHNVLSVGDFLIPRTENIKTVFSGSNKNSKTGKG